jgi:hypothetical protein
VRTTISSRVVWFLGLLFLGMAMFDIITQRRDAMTYTFLFLGLLAAGVGGSLRSIERRLTSIEQSLQISNKGKES